MSLFILLFIPLLGGVLAWFSERFDPDLPKRITFISLLMCWLPLIPLFHTMQFDSQVFEKSQWLVNESFNWISVFNIKAHLALDGLSLLLILLTLLMALVALSSAWHEISKRTGFFYFNLLWTISGVLGVFLAIDLFLFFVFWEVMLVPMYFLISIWGHENRHYAAIKFFIFTQAGGLLMLLSLCGLVGIHFQQTGLLTFDYIILMQNPITGVYAFWIALGFTIAFLVKLPALPFHSWLPDAHTQAPTAASVILAAVLLKTGGYGIIRFVLPLFPDASAQLAPFMMLIGVIGIIYGAMMAFVQTDLKRLVAYSSVSHMGFVLLGCFAFNIYALQGAVMQMLAHGISTSALFVLVGMIQHRYHTRDLNKLGGLWINLPKLSAFGLFFGIASLGMPGLGNFVAEFLILVGSFEKYPILTVLATSGLILAAVYSLLLIYKTFFGKVNSPHDSSITDTNIKEWFTLLAMCFILIFLGLHPQPIFDFVPIKLMNIAFISSSMEATL